VIKGTTKIDDPSIRPKGGIPIHNGHAPRNNVLVDLILEHDATVESQEISDRISSSFLQVVYPNMEILHNSEC
jgi:hypothetical protein